MSEDSTKPGSDYYRGARPAIAKHFTKGAHRVLDIGCGAGLFGAHLKQNGLAAHVTGIELNPDAAAEARNNIDIVHCADLNSTPVEQIIKTFPSKEFDYITCNDVLEHLIDPWGTLHSLASRLSPGGQIIASIPNVRHWSVWLPLIMRGRWDYTAAGIMDRTHLRFFTRKTMQEMFAQAGLYITGVYPMIGGKWRLLDNYSIHILRDFLAIQWVLIGTQHAPRE